jgi:hypothetical protein
MKDNKPVYRKQFKIPDAHYPFLEKSQAYWLKLGVVKKSDSLYNSPVFCIPKKGGNKYCIVQDFLELNQKSMMDKHTMNEWSCKIHNLYNIGSHIRVMANAPSC